MSTKTTTATTAPAKPTPPGRLAPPYPVALLDRLLLAALDEDVGGGDITTQLTVPPGTAVKGRIVAKDDLVLAGAFVAQRVFFLVEPAVELRWLAADGALVRKGDVVAEISGPAQGVLTGERLALNFLQRLSGIATGTRAMVDAAAGNKARIVDTRKTTPGLRALEKWAVRVGGGANHRAGLHDGILIKDNHLAAAGGITPAVNAARAGAPHTMRVEVEVDSLAQLEEAITAGAEVVLIDNFGEGAWPAVVKAARGRVLIEISGNMDVRRAALAAQAGADFISAGVLTHSVRAADLSLRLDVVKGRGPRRK